MTVTECDRWRKRSPWIWRWESFKLNVTDLFAKWRGDGEPYYITIQKGTVHETRVRRDGAVCVDYNAAGEVIGVEVIDPCEAHEYGERG